MTYIPPHLRSQEEKDLLLHGKKNLSIMNGTAKAPAKRKHEEADLHLAFCKWVKLTYPNNQFIRHEREGKRSWYMQNLFKMYNSDLDKMPDFELLEPSGKKAVTEQSKDGMSGAITSKLFIVYQYHRLYIEFKRPGTTLTLKDGITIKSDYKDQYKRHIRFWEQGSPTYFCSDLEHAKELFIAYKSGKPHPQQLFEIR